MNPTGKIGICKNCGKTIIQTYCATDKEAYWEHKNISMMFNRNACRKAEVA